NANGVFQFGLFNGSGLTLIANPDNSSVGFNFNYAIAFDNKLCARYVNASGVKQLATYNGTSWTLLPNPDNTTTRGVVADYPIIYKNKVYFEYYSATNQYQYMQYDGTNNPTLIPNPENSSTNNGGVSGFPIIYNDTLFFIYDNTSNVYQLGKLDGTTATLVPNPDNSPFGYYNTPIVYNNNLYIFYVTADGVHHLAQYQTAANSLKLYSNPDAGLGYWDQPIVYDNNLYFMYSNAQSLFQLGYFNGTSLNLLTNPSGIYNGADGNNGNTGNPIVFNNFLYMQFGSVPYGNAGNLAYFDGSTLPVTFLNFDGVIQNGKSILSWSTSNEINNKGFEVQKSDNGQTFTDLGFVAGHNNSSTVNNYTYTDVKVVSGANYYRLKQIDNNGNFAYSSVIKLDYSAFDWNLLGNPASGNSWIQLQLDKSSEVSIQIVSMNGNIIQTINKGNLSAGTFSIPINLSGKSAGLYIVRLVVNGQVYSKKLIK
ncbi:MAG: T9SS type A sorting domain-containing protein, partial [Chitinophagaceae bacterium]